MKKKQKEIKNYQVGVRLKNGCLMLSHYFEYEKAKTREKEIVDRIINRKEEWVDIYVGHVLGDEIIAVSIINTS